MLKLQFTALLHLPIVSVSTFPLLLYNITKATDRYYDNYCTLVTYGTPLLQYVHYLVTLFWLVTYTMIQLSGAHLSYLVWLTLV
jgi:hypothetical protein